MRKTAFTLLLSSSIACGSNGSSPAEPTTPATVVSSPSTPIPTFVNFQGRWDGNLQITACTSTLGTNDICSEFPVGGSSPVTLVLWQSVDLVSGPISITSLLPNVGVYTGSAYGVIGTNQTLTVAGNLQGTGLDFVTYNVVITSWQSALSANGGLSCAMSMQFRQDGVPGVATISATSSGLTWTQPA